MTRFSAPAICLLDKPSGISSAQAIARLKHRLSIAKIGHAGTLDPMASGLLVCLLNGATRLAQFAESGRKRYRGLIRLGCSTSTDDIEGEVLTRNENVPDFSCVEAMAATFVGDLEQVPPQISAVKVGGVRSYARARAGETVELKARAVKLYSLHLAQRSPTDLEFVLECSAGFYVRSLARDLGDKLGVGGCLAQLRREASYPFDVSDAKTIDKVEIADFLGVEQLFPDSARLLLSAVEAQDLKRGEQRGLVAAVTRAGVVDAQSRIVYFDERQPKVPLGLLVRDGAQWRIGVNWG